MELVDASKSPLINYKLNAHRETPLATQHTAVKIKNPLQDVRIQT